jgi:hypothetical protein
VNAPHVPHFFFLLFQSAHRAQGAVTRLLRGKPGGDALLDLLLKVEPELLIELLIRLAAAEIDLRRKGAVNHQRSVASGFCGWTT